MATFEKIEKELNVAKEKLNEAERKLEGKLKRLGELKIMLAGEEWGIIKKKRSGKLK